MHDLNQLDVLLTKGAFKRGQENPAWPAVENVTSGGQSLTFIPKAKTEILGYDTSCQAGTMQIIMPNATFYGGNGYSASLITPTLSTVTNSSRAGVEFDMTSIPVELRPRFNSIYANTTFGMFHDCLMMSWCR